MEIESIGAVVSGESSSTRQLGLGQEEFLKILLAQLSFQDPLEPVDNQEFIAQLAQFSTLEFNRTTNEKLDGLLALNSANQALSLIGREVEISTDSGTQTGTVKTLRFQEGAPLLSVVLTGSTTVIDDVNLSQIFLVR